MNYKSTRGQVAGIQFKDAVMMGLAEDGGLLVPESVPAITPAELAELATLPYADVAYRIISRFVDDIEPAVLKQLIDKSYAAFDHPDVIPVIPAGGVSVVELFHGPTFAFKDVALQFLGNLFEHILTERNTHMNIIGATSGDTGSAAIYGVRGKKNVNIFILHPKGRVSPVQELQMTSVTDENVYNLAVTGTFDDCQDIVKTIFGELDFKREFALGAVNSINWARILAQIVYYFWAYFRVVQKPGEEKASFVVPTGNFGNIFAGYYAKLMGLPVDKIILATNRNNILSRFVNDGDYTVDKVYPTHSPSMDIQVASNFERYLYFFYNQDANKIASLMQTMKTTGGLTFSKEEVAAVAHDFMTYSTDNDETVETIKAVYAESGYVLDPHTACGVNAARKLGLKNSTTLCLATAHPAKFPDVVEAALGITPEEPQGIKKLYGSPRNVNDMTNDVEAVKAFVRTKVAR